MKITEGYLVSKLEFRTDPDDYSTAVIPQDGMYYRDLQTNRIFAYDNTALEFRDISFYQGYRYTWYNDAKKIDSNRIYLAKPGQRIIGLINGIEEDSCSLTKNLNNTSELTFTVDRILDGNLGHADISDGRYTQYYDLIERHYELYLPYHGWFKINEEPEIDNDGTVETKSVRAESLEIELQQYDLVNFDINSGEVYSKEMLATDNTYDNNGYKMFRDRVLFYRDTTALENAIKEFAETDGSVEALKEFAKTHAEIVYQDLGNNVHTGCWRITYNVDKQVIEIEDKVEPDNEESDERYTGTEILENELKREHELSLLWLILHEHGWNVGYVDPWFDANSELEDDHIPLANKTGFFQVDSQDIYSFLTQDAAAYYRCIFVFDTEHYLVNAYNINNIGYDTNIFLSFQNVQNEVTRTSDRDLYTVFHVQGAEELDFTEANFGEDWIEDISYFLNTNHFSQEFIDKYNAWLQLREQKRPEYMQLSVDFRNQTDTVNEINYRVPTDAADGDQYKTMTEEELINEKANMRAMRYGFEHSVLYAQTDEHDEPIKDEDGNYVFDIEKMKASVDWPVYSSLIDIVLSYPDNEEDEAIDHIEFKQGQESDDYEYDFEDSYKQQYTDPQARLGNIDIALLNRRIIDGYYVKKAEEAGEELTDLEKMKRNNVKNQKEFLDDYKFDFVHYGYLYGLEELKNYEKSYYGTLSALDSNGYGEKSDGTSYEDETSKKYEKYKKALAEVQAEIVKRQEEYDNAKAVLEDTRKQMDAMKEAVSIDNAGFTDEELTLLDKYYIHTDYTNDNILTTNISTNEQIVEAEHQLYLDAMEELYVESHPQYTWSTTQDNLLLMPEFHDWHGSLHVGNFIRISFRDDYQVKLRVSSITLNPLMLEPTIDLEFTTMTQYKAKRNDFAAILDQANSSTKNSITSSISRNSSKDNTINVDSALVLKLLNSSTFRNYMGSNNANIAGTAVSAVSGNIEQIATGVISGMDINVGRIVGSQLEFDEMFTKYLKSNLIVTKALNAETADIEHLTAKIIDVGGTQITDGLIKTAELSADQITSGTINTDRLNATDVVVSGLLSAQAGDFEDLTAQSAFVEYLNSGIIEAGTVSADTIIAGLADVTPEQIDKFDLLAGSAFIDYLETNMVVASEIQVDDLKAKLATIDTLTAGSAFVTYLQGLSSSVIQSNATSAYILNLVAGNISVADLQAGNIVLTDSMQILSENGQMVMNGRALQIMGEDSNGDPYVGIQLGYDTNENPSLILRNEEGATILTPSGITSDAVADGLIVNNMIGNETIEKNKLAFPIVETNDDGTINITSIKDGSGGNFGVEYTTFKQGTTDALDEINSQKMYRVTIESDNGNIFKNGDVNCTLSCKVYSWDDDITDDINASNFTWTRKSKDTAGDTQWNANHSGGTKTLTITPADVYGRSVFYCTVALPDGSTVTGT